MIKSFKYILISLIITCFYKPCYSLETLNKEIKKDHSLLGLSPKEIRETELKPDNKINDFRYSFEPPRPITPKPYDFPNPEIPSQSQPPVIETPVTPSTSSPNLPDIPDKIIIKEFKFVGNTAFSQEELSSLLESFINKDISFAELISAEQKITNFYLEKGYINSGAIIESGQKFDPQGAIITMTIIEGSIKEIDIKGLTRLNQNYIKSRLEIATQKPFNVNRLFEALQLLQLDPLIENISAELASGTQANESLLLITVKEADSFSLIPILNNGRNPSVGSFQRGLKIQENNLFGFGDSIDISFKNTDGSNTFDGSYTIPLNPNNGKLRIAGGFNNSKVIQQPFDVLDITGTSEYYEIGYSQPVIQVPTQELSLGLTLTIESSNSFLQGEPFPLSIGSDINGNTKVSALRFYQDFIQRNSNEVFALRSQFSLGIEAFGATNNDNLPDSNFFAWRNQAQYVRQLAPDTLFITRTDLQISANSLVPLEQFSLGGLNSVRGYPQDILLTDNGFLISTEIWLPVLRIKDIIKDNDGVLQVIPFFDLGIGWNTGDFPNPNPNTLIGVGLGLQMQISDNFSARLDWGIPLKNIDVEKNDWNANGIYFNINAKF